MVRACFLVLSLTLLVAFTVATKDRSTGDDLTSKEARTSTSTHDENYRRHIAHTIQGEEEEAASSARLISQQIRTRKLVRQSRPPSNIRTVQKSTAGRGEGGYPVLRRQADIQESVDKPAGNKSDDDDDDRKTLSQQIADGKYGLIQKEIFNKDTNRPGIISYEVNPEVPKDNVNNLGGLRPDDIWLAENHLLVLSGGGYQQKDASTPVWPPIDNYVAPLRQVKIPPNPKVPPPFPVQLKDGGPIEFIRNENGTGGPPPLPPFFPPPFPPPGPTNTSENVTLYPYPPPNFNPGNFSPGNGPFLLPPPPFPFFPPPGSQNVSFFLPPPGFFPGIPPGAAFLPPPGNLTDQFDEDDPSLYYPPPYDFYYPKDNSSIVPPGPLVPGIVLPPPPNFFAPLSNTTASKSDKQQPTKEKPASPTKKLPKPRPVTVVTTTEPPTVHTVLTTTPTPPYYTTGFPSTPVYPATTDDVTQPPIVHALPPNAVINEWVPIPAPRPFYITGPRKPLRKGTTTTTLPPDYNSVSPPSDYLNGYLYKTPKSQYKLPHEGWIFPNKTNNYEQELQYFKEITENPKDYYDYYPGSNPGFNQYLTQSLYLGRQRHIKPLTKGLSSTVSPVSVYNQPGRQGKGKSLKATYYFYEEPHIEESQLSDADDIKYDDASYRSTTPVPPGHYYNPAAVRTHPHNGDYDSYLRTTAAPNLKGADVSYYYPDSYASVNPQQIGNENPLNYFQFSGNFRPSQINSVPAKVYKTSSGPGRKQTVYEYSFTAPGYSNQPSKIGTPEKPAVTVEPAAPPARLQFDYYGGYRQSVQKIPPGSQTVFNYDNQLPPYAPAVPPAYKPFPEIVTRNHEYSTEIPANAYYTTTTTTTTTTRKPEQIPIQTENPYHAYFTQQDAGLIDDITKKYFTVFGQKLNKDCGESLTTPLPPAAADDGDVARKAYYPKTTPTPVYYYTTPAPPPYRQKQPQRQRPVYSTLTDQQFSRPVYSYDYGDNTQSLITPAQRKPISLESDTLVNYKQPLPPVNPDAEFVDPNAATKPEKQSLISYTLPGNGGHFYFITPQAAPSDNYQRYDDNDRGGYVYPASPIDTNYKRSAKTSPHTSQPQRISQQQ